MNTIARRNFSRRVVGGNKGVQVHAKLLIEPYREGAGHLSIGLASVVLGICPISCNNPIKKFLYLASANPIVR